jgi:HlyD family secretion protein
MPAPAENQTPTLPLAVPLPQAKAGTRTWARGLGMPVLLALAFVSGGLFAATREPDVFAGIAARLQVEPAAPVPNAVAPPADPSLPVLGLARLMPEGDLIRVSPPFGAGDARVSEIHVAPGDRVEMGALLATLDNRSALESQRLAALALVAQREAAVVQAREAVRIGLMESRASLSEAEAAANAARARLDRARALAERGVATAAALDGLEAEAAQVAQGVARARASLARWDAHDIDAQPDVVVAQRSLDAALIDAERATADLAQSEVRAPIAGTVLEIDIRPGERPRTEGLMTLGRIDRMVARVEVFQTEIGRVREGQVVELTSAPLATPLTGRVERIGLLVGRQNLVSDDTAANTDARVVELIVRLDSESSDRAAGLSNLEAVARIAVADGR